MPMLPLLENWPALAGRIRAARGIALFLDFDGTLAPLMDRPEDVVLARSTRMLLARLALLPRARVCIISGRRLADLRSRVRVPSLRYLGAHGWESRDGKRLAPETLRSMDSARGSFARGLNGTRSIRLEEKGVSFAVHYRGASPEAQALARGVLDRVLRQSSGKLRALTGEAVWEILPNGIRGKGYAARHEWRRMQANALPIYAGNDGTDEPAFQTLASGITILVGPARASRAQFFVPNPLRLREFLEKVYTVLT